MLKKIDHFFIVLQKHLGGIIFAVIFACCVLQVVFRYVLRMKLPLDGGVCPGRYGVYDIPDGCLRNSDEGASVR